MKINTNSNAYTISYAVVVVIVVAFLLAFFYSSLKDRAAANERIDKKQQILSALNLRQLPKDQVESKYKEVVLADYIITADGKIVNEGKEADQAGFQIANKEFSDQQLPLYRCQIDGATKYVIPMIGKGLWGSIWGFVALNDDFNTVYGAYFSHESETAGLGALIKDLPFQKEFEGKRVYKDGNVQLSVVKGGKIDNPTSQCDGITGATLTCNGVNQMLHEYLQKYQPFFAQQSKHNK